MLESLQDVSPDETKYFRRWGGGLEVSRNPRGEKKVMSDEQGKTGNEQDKPVDAIERNVAALHAENLVLKNTVEQLTTKLDSIKTKLKAAEEHIENLDKSTLIAQVQAFSEYSFDYLAKLSVDQLKQMIGDHKNYKPISFASSASIGDPKHPLNKLYSKFDVAQERRHKKKYG